MKIKVYVQPNASVTKIIGKHDGALKIKVKAPPVDGKANKEIIEYLSELLSLPKKSISISHGETGRHKLIEIDIRSAEEATRISALLEL